MRRYQKLSEIIDEDLNILSGLPFLDFLYDGGEVYHTVRSNENRRLDLVAYAYLKDYRLWPILAWYNGISDVLSVKTGDVLAIPVNAVTLLNNVIAFTYRGT